MNELNFTRGIAKALGKGWEAVIAGGQVGLYKDGINRVYLRGDGYNWEQSERVSVSGIYPSFNNQPVLSWYGDNVYPKITCAISRGPAAVARDIERRFLPDFWHHVERADRLVEQYATEAAARRQNAGAIGRIFEVDTTERQDCHRRPHDRATVDFGTYGKGASARVTVGKDDYRFEIRDCPIQLGLQIAKLIKEYDND